MYKYYLKKVGVYESMYWKWTIWLLNWGIILPELGDGTGCHTE